MITIAKERVRAMFDKWDDYMVCAISPSILVSHQMTLSSLDIFPIQEPFTKPARVVK
jgi:hypothetical protein